MKPKILFIDRLAPYTPDDGSSQVIWALGCAMVQEGWDVHYFFPRPSIPSPRRDDISFHPISVPGDAYTASYAFLIFGTPILAKLLNNLKPDLVYDNSTPVPFVPAYLFDRRHIVTRIHHIYGPEVFQFKRGILNPTVTYLGEQWYRVLNARRVIIDSESARRRLGRLIRNVDQVRIISPGIDLSNLPPPSFSAPRQGHMVLALSRLATNKGINYLLEAWAKVEQHNPETYLKIAGTGSEEARLKRLAEKLALKRVEFLGYVREGVKWQLLSQCAIFCFPTLIEGLPVGVLEVMAAGAPIVSTNALGVRDLIKHGKTGYLVEPANSDQLADALLAMLADPQVALQLAREARRQVEERDLRKVNREEIEHLTSLLSTQ